MKKLKNYRNQIKAGVWIDHQRAVIVLLQNDEIKIDEIISGVISHERFKGEGTDKIKSGEQIVNREIHKEAKKQNELKVFYEKIVDQLIDSSHIYIVGPAEAKYGLGKQIKKHKVLKNISLIVAAADNLSVNKIVAEVKKIYNADLKAV